MAPICSASAKKIWQAGDRVIDRRRISADWARGFAFLADLSEEERVLAGDQYQREHDLWKRLNPARA